MARKRDKTTVKRAPAQREKHGTVIVAPAEELEPLRTSVGVIGTGYVGLITATGFAELGNNVWCVDVDGAKIERIKHGEVPIYEPGLKQLLEANAERLHFTTALDEVVRHSRLLFVAVGTPKTHAGDADLSAVSLHALLPARLMAYRRPDRC